MTVILDYITNAVTTKGLVLISQKAWHDGKYLCFVFNSGFFLCNNRLKSQI